MKTKYSSVINGFFLSLIINALCLGTGIEVGSPDENAKAKYGYTWSGCDSCAEPESAYYDAISGSLFISNVAGVGDKKDGNGFIQKLDPSGKVIVAKWVTGLNAPKGMRVSGDSLWVSDIDEVVEIKIRKGKIVSRVKVPGAKFLNDVEVGKDNVVYVSDTLGGKIYAVKGGKVNVFAEGDKLDSPNGLLLQGDKLVVASWGLTTDFSTKVPGGLYTLDLKTRARVNITKEPLGNLDGLELDEKGNYLTSDWKAGKVFRVTPEGKSELLFYGFKGSADIAYIASSQTLVVPRMGENLITAFSLTNYPLN